MRRATLAAAALTLAVVLAGGTAAAGSTSGFGAARTVGLADAGNGLTVTGPCPETISGFTGVAYRFSFVGSAATAAGAYTVSVIVSPGSDVPAYYNGTAQVQAGAGNASVEVVIPPDDLRFTAANTPFAIELRAPNGTLVDTAEFSVDLRYREPPADGGLLALAITSAAVWGIVFLYALNLHFAQRKLRARADALEGAVKGPSAGVRADGKER
jgi:hypothetical protein